MGGVVFWMFFMFLFVQQLREQCVLTDVCYVCAQECLISNQCFLVCLSDMSTSFKSQGLTSCEEFWLKAHPSYYIVTGSQTSDNI